MAQLGTFTKAPDGIYRGKIRSLMLNVDLEIRPFDSLRSISSIAPSHLVFAGDLETGVASEKTGKDGRLYLSVKLDDPTFPAPVYFTVSCVESVWLATWSRPGAARFERAA